MAQLVVDLLEVVQVHEQNADLAPVFRLQCAFKNLEDGPAVHEPRERIVPGEMAEALIGIDQARAAFGDEGLQFGGTISEQTEAPAVDSKRRGEEGEERQRLEPTGAPYGRSDFNGEGYHLTPDAGLVDGLSQEFVPPWGKRGVAQLRLLPQG